MPSCLSAAALQRLAEVVSGVSAGATQIFRIDLGASCAGGNVLAQDELDELRPDAKDREPEAAAFGRRTCGAG